ncbi:hypothetical protein DYB25_002592 [Aphanomyces astaci]|uniref:N-acetyltransferase domain-containing protein n=1 Tax=Aphanomyces astaci TaxID=112090 RepID=A0A397BK18_APHAT|nr:hypothetical protein DYB25_002592 [Aphanomyces astaci]
MPFAIRALRTDEVDAWVAHCTEVFKHDSSAYFVSHLQDDSSALEDMNNILVADEDGTIAATVRVIPRSQFIGGRVVSMGGIAEVSTKKKFRGKGLASKLLRAAIDGPLASVDVSALHTDADRLGGFYGKLGYTPMPLKSVSIPVNLPLPPLSPQLHIAPLTDLAIHTSALLRLYHTVSSKFNGPIQRTEAYICQWIAARHRRDHIQAVGAWNAQGQLVGYVFGRTKLQTNDNTILVDELIVPNSLPESHAVAVHLLAALAATPGPCAFVVSNLPVPVANELGFLPTAIPQDVVISEDRGFMVQRHGLALDLWQNLAKTGTNNVFWKSDGF